ncbi:MAG: alpha/beta hydrolase fold domain-containing protein [Anaerolineales bacterium]
MKKKFSIITTIAAVLSACPFIRSKSRDMITLLWLPKLLSGAFSLWLALIGIISVIYGWMRRDRQMILTGGIGSILSLHYIRRVTSSHRGFEGAFGSDWETKIPGSQRGRLQRLRWPILIAPKRGIPHQRDLVFATSPATGKPLLADLWLPPQRSQVTGLGVIYIHGGAWRLGAKDVGTRTIFQHLANLGHAVMDIDYTLWPESNMTNMAYEVKLAIAWFKKNHQGLGINPERVVLMGGSAGAHLALLAGYTADVEELRPEGLDADLSVRGVIAYYPPVDFRNLPEDLNSLMEMPKPGSFHKVFQDNIIRFMNDTMRIATTLRSKQKHPRQTMTEASLFTDPAQFLSQIIGGPLEEIPETYALLSPAAHVRPGLPPTLLLQGTDDFFQLLPGVQRLHYSLQAAGVKSILVEFPHCEHAFDLILPQISPAAQASTYDVERFLAMMI